MLGPSSAGTRPGAGAEARAGPAPGACDAVSAAIATTAANVPVTRLTLCPATSCSPSLWTACPLLYGAGRRVRRALSVYVSDGVDRAGMESGRRVGLYAGFCSRGSSRSPGRRPSI
ncbi:hypothetical protein GCM10023086_01660 [Streptomyces venetus]|uniref:Uncharacterized protein n=1 Tax=Streptomyces venetus TaxID=1701086 RepID=A0ABP8F116_9ACTN